MTLAFMSPRHQSNEAAFTLIELLTVVAVIGILAAMLLPVLGRSKFRARVTNCTSNFKQWMLAANLYAADDSRGNLPSFRVFITGMNPMAVACENDPDPGMVLALGRYGLTIPMWFCPVRSQEYVDAQEAFRNGGNPENGSGTIPAQHRNIATLQDLDKFLTYRLPKHGHASLYYNWWVPREGPFSQWFPVPQQVDPFIWTRNAVFSERNERLGWPKRVEDNTAAIQPILSDWCEGEGDDHDVGHANSRSGHPFNGSVANVNVGFADGHVELHPRAMMEWQMSGNRARQSFFY
jgi:prepilin-type N-terminal cleavage/methylation domain-containing protein/prepilin-type processing-associated H-X9-DG protein